MKEIKDLIEKYYEGGTSLEEEKKLSDFFRKGDIPEELQLYKTQFNFYESEKRYEPLSSDFDDKILDKITQKKIIIKEPQKPRFILKIVSIAASLIILISAYFIFYPENIKDDYSLTTQEQYELEQTLIALNKVSHYIEKADHELKKISIFKSSLQELDKLTYYEKYKKYFINILGDES
jgi:hypothetical protein